MSFTVDAIGHIFPATTLTEGYAFSVDLANKLGAMQICNEAFGHTTESAFRQTMGSSNFGYVPISQLIAIVDSILPLFDYALDEEEEDVASCGTT